MPKHDIFICFSSGDADAAGKVVSFLEANGLRCWISNRDVEPGHNYQESIVRALEGAKAIVFLLSENSNRSNEVKKELSLGASDDIPVIPLRLSPVSLSGALRYELATRQWIDASEDIDRAFEKLLNAVRGALDPSLGAHPSEAGAPAPRVAPSSQAAAKVSTIRLGTEDFEAVRGLLARHVGPIAKVLMQKAVAEARSSDELCERLANYVQAPAERARFAQAVRARLGVKS
jgi:hypothetical protein